MNPDILAERFRSHEGFEDASIAELRELGERVLTRHDGLALEVVCIVDASRHRFELPRDEIQRIAKACARHSAGVLGASYPRVQIIEIGAAASDADRERLLGLRPRGFMLQAKVSAAIVDPSGAVWSTAEKPDQRLAKLLDPDLPPPEPSVEPRKGAPKATLAIVAVLVAAFVAELALSIDPIQGIASPGPRTLILLGSVDRALVADGGWHRLLTAALLHGDAIHLACNCAALVGAGWIVEGLVGPLWLVALFGIGAAGGSLLSIALNAPDTVSVGASGAIMGLFGAGLLLTRRLGPGRRSAVRAGILRTLIPALMPAVASGVAVDVACHFGGVLAGVIGGAAILAAWPAGAKAPRVSPFPLAAAVVLAFAGAATRVALQYRSVSTGLQLAPNDLPPKYDKDPEATVRVLLTDYPLDPRGHMLHALRLHEQRDVVGAERELEAALARPEALAYFGKALEVQIRIDLALLLLENERASEAREAARPVCAAAEGEQKHTLAELKVCP